MTPKRRTRVEPGIYTRPDGRYEIGFRDAQGRQRWRVVEGGIAAARKALTDEKAKRHRGEKTSDRRVTFGRAADRWLEGPVATLRPNTRSSYSGAVENHLRKRFGRARLDDITPEDMAGLVADMRGHGYAEWTISTVLMVTGQVFRYASRRMGWHGTSPTTLLERGERPHVAATAKRRIFQGDELARTIAAATEPYTTLFVSAAITAARQSELLGLIWLDVDLGEEPEIRFRYQVDRHGRRQPLKTEGSSGVVPIPKSLAAMLQEHKLRSPYGKPSDFVFASRVGTPINQRNVGKALHTAMTTAGVEGCCFHSFRHTAASQAFARGDRVEEVAWMLRHKSSQTTKAVYLHEIRDQEAKAKRRRAMEASMEALDGSKRQHPTERTDGEVVDLQRFRDRRQQTATDGA